MGAEEGLAVGLVVEVEFEESRGGLVDVTGCCVLKSNKGTRARVSVGTEVNWMSTVIT